MWIYRISDLLNLTFLAKHLLGIHMSHQRDSKILRIKYMGGTGVVKDRHVRRHSFEHLRVSDFIKLHLKIVHVTVLFK